jgi:tetratricopeptide (TPR) repeat protein
MRPSLAPLGQATLEFISILSMVCLMAGCASSSGAAGNKLATGDPLESVSPADLFEYGARFAAHGDLLRAEEYLSVAIQRGYAATRALPLLLKVCVASQRLSSALHYAEPYLQLHPDDVRLRYLVATVQLGMSRPEQARRELQRVIHQVPDSADAQYLLGIIERDYRHDTKAAAEHFRRHQALAPQGTHAAEVAAWLRDDEAYSEFSGPGEGPGAAPTHSEAIRVEAVHAEPAQ